MNKHGLSRDIPEGVKREVRQRCGFGCVVCGSAIYQYEHFSPEYSDAKNHDPLGITLLCGGCHDRKTRGQLSVETIIESNNKPKALENGFSHGPFDIGHNPPEILFGNVTMLNAKILLQVFGEPVFIITSPKNAGETFKISATLRDREGNISLRIEENEWQTPSDNWDCKVEGQRIIINSNPNKLDLVLRVDPPNKIIIEKLFMTYLNCTISCKENEKLKIELGSKVWETKGGLFENCQIGIDISDEGMGLCFGGGNMHLENLTISPKR